MFKAWSLYAQITFLLRTGDFYLEGILWFQRQSKIDICRENIKHTQKPSAKQYKFY